MINLLKAKQAFKKTLEQFNEKEKLGFNLKIVHTYHVMDNSKTISCRLELSEEDILLAELIGLLHDIGRFEELIRFDKFDSVNNDHATVGVQLLFEGDLIRDFIEDSQYDEIIKKAILNHNKLVIENGLDDRTLLHSKIIRDADKLDNFRVAKEESIEAIFPNVVNKIEEFEYSEISDKVYDSIINKRCVDVHDRKTPLDYWCCLLAFIFDLNFKQSFEIIKENNYINLCIDRFNYYNQETKERMKKIKEITNNYIEEKTK